ncbi:MAG TPA: DUF6095 family protein [Flavobacteriaceae bacterium]|nr:DUF6095 family protein [Flavobacteriaceae bacterium]
MTVLKSGIKKLLISLPLLFLGPYLITLSFLNKDNYSFYIFFFFGLVTAITAVYFAFKGINTVTTAVFGEKKKN